MKQNFPTATQLKSAPGEDNLVDPCYHCGTKHGIGYFKESDGNDDLYYCAGCYGLFEWNGQKFWPIDGEAYPLRNKSQDMAQKIK